MLPDNIESFAIAAFRERLKKGIITKTVPDAEFADIIYTAVSQFKIDELQFRTMFGLTSGATERWMQMKNLPQPIVRNQIISWIMKAMDVQA